MDAETFLDAALIERVDLALKAEVIGPGVRDRVLRRLFAEADLEEYCRPEPAERELRRLMRDVQGWRGLRRYGPFTPVT